MGQRIKIAFLWEDMRRDKLDDGLGMAMKDIATRQEVRYFEPDNEIGILGFKPDVLLYWAPLSARTKDQVVSYPFKKAIAFAGGPIDETNVDGFDLYFTESEINEQELTKFNKPWIRAFGINEDIFTPQKIEKRYDGCFAGAYAKWKRHELFAEALTDRGVATGFFQNHEPECFEVCVENGVKTYTEQTRQEVANLINESHTVVNTADLWGGGQRLTLEAMACNVPVIVMSDSPKNVEYIKESGFGLVVDPNVDAIREAVDTLKGTPVNSRPYILEKFSYRNYAKVLEENLCNL